MCLNQTALYNATIYDTLQQLEYHNISVQNLNQTLSKTKTDNEKTETDLTDRLQLAKTSLDQCDVRRTTCVNSLKTCQRTYDAKQAQFKQVLVQRNKYLNDSMYLDHTLNELSSCRLQFENEKLTTKNLTEKCSKCEQGTLVERIDAFEKSLSSLKPTDKTTTTTTTTTTTPPTTTPDQSENLFFVGTTETGYFDTSSDSDLDFANGTTVSVGPTKTKCLLTASMQSFFYLSAAFIFLSLLIIWLIICGCQKRLQRAVIFERESALNSAERTISELKKQAAVYRQEIAKLEHVIEYSERQASRRAAPTSRDAAEALNFQVR